MATPARRSRRWLWTLSIPTVAPLLSPLYDRATPALAGIPFFYWYQIACALLALIIMVSVHLATRPRQEASR